MVVRLQEGHAAVQSYIGEQVRLGKEHVLDLMRSDRDTVLSLIDDLSEEEARTQSEPDEWSIAEAMTHVNATLRRSRDRISTLAAGQLFLPAPPGEPDGEQPIAELRARFRETTDAVIGVVSGTPAPADLDVTASHAAYGAFNWLGWAVFSHHVHIHDHIGQISEARAALGR